MIKDWCVILTDPWSALVRLVRVRMEEVMVCRVDGSTETSEVLFRVFPFFRHTRLGGGRPKGH